MANMTELKINLFAASYLHFHEIGLDLG